MHLINTILNQDFFAGVLILTAVVILIRQRHFQSSVALLFFIGGYWATQLPLISGVLTSLPEKYLAQGVISLCLVMVYSTIDVSRPVLIAAVNEVILIAVNIVFSMVEIHQWFHWSIFSFINWISFIALCYNWWMKEYDYQSHRSKRSDSKIGLHVYSSSLDNDKKI